MPQTLAPARARFFHGTVVELAPGDMVVPGDEIGVSNFGRSTHVYATTTDPRAVGAEPDEDQDEDEDGLGSTPLSRAWDTAAFFAAQAADGACTGTSCCDREDEDDADAHADCLNYGSVPTCLRVYEVEPVGPVERDGSGNDAGPEAVRMPYARVIGRVGPDGETA